MDEFEIMRRQLASMKQQLDDQQIVNKNLMRKVMSGKASWMNMLVTVELIALPFIYLLFVGICHGYGVSQWYSFAFLIFAGIDALFDIRTVRIPGSLFSTLSILDLKKFLVRQKKERFIQTCIGGILCICWGGLFSCAMLASNDTLFPDNNMWEAAKSGGLIGGFIGAVVGGMIIVVLYRKMQRTNDRILDDIDRYENGM